MLGRQIYAEVHLLGKSSISDIYLDTPWDFAQ